MPKRFRSFEEFEERIKRALPKDEREEKARDSIGGVEHFEFPRSLVELEDPEVAIDTATSEPPPLAVTRALEAGAAAEREEATGEILGERKDGAIARLRLLGIEDPESYIAKHGKTLELRLKILETQKKRDQLAELEAAHLAKGDRSEAEKERLEDMRTEYEKARAEYIGESALRMTRERTHLTDAIAEKHIEEKGWGTEIYNLWKKLGDMNLTRLGWEPKGRVGKFVARFVSVRSAVSFGLLGAGLALGAGSAAGITAIALRRGLAGLGAGIGSYDLMRFGGEKWAESKGVRREVTQDEASNMEWKDITKRLEHFEAAARLQGEKVSEMPGYTTLLLEYRLRIEGALREAEIKDGEVISLWLKEKGSEADLAIDDRAMRMKMSDRRKKAIAVGIGVFIGSGLFAKVVGATVGRAREALFGPAEPPPDLTGTKLVAEGPDGERVAIDPQGQMDYAPPVPKEGVGEISPEATPTEAPPETPTPPQETLVTATTGDNSWKMVARALHDRYGERFDTLDSARKSWIIDWINQQVEKDPQLFGIRGTRLIRPGDTMDLSKLFSDAPRMERAFDATEGLSEEKVASITRHQSTVRDWLRTNPEAKLRPGDIDRIIQGKLDEAMYEADSPPAPPVSLDIHAEGGAPVTEVAEASGASPTEVHDALQHVREMGAAPSLTIEAGGIVRTPTGEVMVRFSYGTNGLPKNIEWNLKPDVARAVAVLPHGWQDGVPSVKERFALLQSVIDLEKAERVFRELKRAGLGDTQEGRFVNRLIHDTRETLEQRLRAPSEAVAEPAETAIPRGRVVETDPRAAHDEAMDQLEAASRSAARFVNVKLSPGERMDSLRELIGEDGHATEYNGVKYEARGDRIFFEIGKSGAHEVTPDKLDVLAEYSRLGELVMKVPEDELERRIADILKRLFGTK